MKVCKDVNHIFPICKKRLGQYRRSIYDIYGIKVPTTPAIDMRVFYEQQNNMLFSLNVPLQNL